MKRVKQINNWNLMIRRKSDPYYNNSEENRNYVVVAPDKIVMEDRLTLEEAEDFCKSNTDHVKRK